MISMTKEQMVAYLYDYANTIDLMFKNRTVPVRVLFNEYAFKRWLVSYENSPEYYDVMRRTYTAYNCFRFFSIIEDFLLNRDDFLSNNDLSGLESGCQIIESPHDLTNKRIIQLIRNAFNHNDANDIERFKISVNGRYFEIYFRDIRTQKEIDNGVLPRPVRIKFNIEYLLNVIKIIGDKRQNVLYLSFDIPEDFNIYSNDLDSELDKIKFVHYYFPKKLDKSVIDKFNTLGYTKDLNEEEIFKRSDELNEYARQINEAVRFDLDVSQKEKLKAMIIRYLNGNKPLDIDNYAGTCSLMFYFLSKVIPVPGFKVVDLEQQMMISNWYLLDTNLSYDDIIDRVGRVAMDKPKPNYYDKIDCTIHDCIAQKGKSFASKMFLNCLDGEFGQALPVITFIDAVITHYCNDVSIEINGKIYEREKLRNSFVHQRWYIDKDLNLCMFDADPRNINDYDLELVGKISIIDFFEWASNYYVKRDSRKKLF